MIWYIQTVNCITNKFKIPVSSYFSQLKSIFFGWVHFTYGQPKSEWHLSNGQVDGKKGFCPDIWIETELVLWVLGFMAEGN